MTPTSTHRSFGANALATVIQIAYAGIAAALRWQDRSKAMRHLRDLEDFRLKDMGLARDQIEAAVNGRIDPRRHH